MKEATRSAVFSHVKRLGSGQAMCLSMCMIHLATSVNFWYRRGLRPKTTLLDATCFLPVEFLTLVKKSLITLSESSKKKQDSPSTITNVKISMIHLVKSGLMQAGWTTKIQKTGFGPVSISYEQLKLELTSNSSSRKKKWKVCNIGPKTKSITGLNLNRMMSKLFLQILVLVK